MSDSGDAMPTRIRALLGLLVILAVGFGGLSYLTRPPAISLEPIARVEPFTLTDQSGASFSSSQLTGKVWIADVIFTRCMGPCPLMSAKMARLQQVFAGEADVRFVSISADPIADTPAALRDYATKYKADLTRWTFLTGDVKTIYDLVERSFKLPVGQMPPLDRIQAGDLITHSTRFVLVDREGNIRGFFESENADFHDRMVEAVRAVL